MEKRRLMKTFDVYDGNCRATFALMHLPIGKIRSSWRCFALRNTRGTWKLEVGNIL